MAVPSDTPLTSPVEDMEAIPAVLLLHVPPVTTSLSADVNPLQTARLPAMAAGRGFTVTIANVPQPVAGKYEMVATPAATPVTTPLTATVAIPGVTELHVPPEITSVKIVVVPGQTSSVPVIAGGRGFTVTTALFTHPAGLV